MATDAADLNRRSGDGDVFVGHDEDVAVDAPRRGGENRCIARGHGTCVSQGDRLALCGAGGAGGNVVPKRDGVKGTDADLAIHDAETLAGGVVEAAEGEAGGRVGGHVTAPSAGENLCLAIVAHGDDGGSRGIDSILNHDDVILCMQVVAGDAGGQRAVLVAAQQVTTQGVGAAEVDAVNPSGMVVVESNAAAVIFAIRVTRVTATKVAGDASAAEVKVTLF